MSSRDLKRLVKEAAAGSDPKARVDLYLKALALAIELEDEKAEFDIRFQLLTSALYDTPNTELSLACFTWCLAKIDEGSRRYASAANVESLMWVFKWILAMLIDSDAFTREQIEAALDDMERRYRAQGYGIHGVLTTRHYYALCTGLIDEADGLLDTIARTPRDDHANCEACVAADRVDHEASLGRDDRAIAEYRTMLNGASTCGTQPESTEARMLMPLLRTGQQEEAAATFKRCYEACRTRERLLSTVALCAKFVAVTGNESSALGMIERHIGWLDFDPLDTGGHFTAAECFHVALLRLERAGHGETQASIPHVVLLQTIAPGLGRNPKVSVLREACYALAENIAVRMDRRNGNDAWMRDLQRSVADADIDDRIPLESAPFNPLTGTPTQPDSAYGWLMRARGLSTVGLLEEAAQAAERAADGGEPTASSALALAASLRLELGDTKAAEKALARRFELLSAAKQPAAMLAQRYDHEVALHHLASLERLEEAYQSAVSTPGAEDYVLSVAIAALSAIADSDLVAARTWQSRAAAVVEHADDPYRKTQLAMLDVRLALDAEDAPTAATIALEIASTTSEPLLKAAAESLAASALGSQGDVTTAARLTDSAAARFASNGAGDAAAWESVASGQYWASVGEHSAAASRFQFALPRLEADGNDTAELKILLGESLTFTDRQAEARELVEPLIESLSADPDAWRSLVQVLWIVANHTAFDVERTQLFGRVVELARDRGDADDVALALVRWYAALDEYDRPEDTADQLAAQLQTARLALAHDDPLRAECVFFLLDYTDGHGGDAAGLIDDGLACAMALGTSEVGSRLLMYVARALEGAREVDRAVAALDAARERAVSEGIEDEDVLGPLYFPLVHLSGKIMDPATRERILRACIAYADAPDWFLEEATEKLVKLLKKAGRHDEAAALG
ncbi:MAG: hypothetical protein CVT64_05350 [Actinobacteria bacterium HGW-Actinobacteria-4]|nr:MAG: hypothetical protein CVT64_05350 [Actinobacteria bacterium HGW-Actinobacteria-4]